jgi:CRP/FNR family transcriptional regulator, cyclic AMP receptor protein
LPRWKQASPFFSKAIPANAVFYIQKGRIKLTVNLQRGKEATNALLGVGNFLIACNLASCPSCP